MRSAFAVLFACYFIFINLPCAFAKTEATQLNTVETARTLPENSLSLQFDTLPPYYSGSIGAQFSDRFYMQLRQTVQTSNILDGGKKALPGMDLKLKLFNETHFTPQVALGLKSAIGHKKQAGEYIALTKRFYDFDVTGGMAWGRLGSAADIKNPLRILSDSHFGKERPLDGNDSNKMSDWFTGEDVAFFGGVSWQTPYEPLKLTLDWNGDAYKSEEQTIAGYEGPDRWAIGAQYTPFPWLELSGAYTGGDKFMARARFFDTLPTRSKKAYKDNVQYNPVPRNILSEHSRREHPKTRLVLADGVSTPYQIRQNADLYLAEANGQNIETLSIQPVYFGLQGPDLILPKRGLDAVLNGSGSGNELWHSMEVKKNSKAFLKNSPSLPLSQNKYGLKLQHVEDITQEYKAYTHRTSLLAEGRQILPFNLIAGFGLRSTLYSSMQDTPVLKSFPKDAVRSDEILYTKNPVNIERAYLAKLISLNPEIHMGVSAGYLEEMFAGAGGEILYRPWDKRWAIGAEGWLVKKRDAKSSLARDTKGDLLRTGHLNLYYDIPYQNLTASVNAGYFLAEDMGAKFELSKSFSNGARVAGFITVTDETDKDVFGSDMEYYSGLTISMPFNIPKAPGYIDKICCETELQVRPLARDKGQKLDNPLPLYQMSERISSRELRENWQDIAP